MRDYNVLDCSDCIVEVIKTIEDKINDIKAKSKNIVTQKLIQVLNSFSVSSFAKHELSSNMEAFLISSTRL